jgi:hypothetical protein
LVLVAFWGGGRGVVQCAFVACTCPGRAAASHVQLWDVCMVSLVCQGGGVTWGDSAVQEAAGATNGA